MAGSKPSFWVWLKYYINPFARLGVRKYSYRLPLAVTVWAIIVTELVSRYVFPVRSQGGLIVIFVFLGLIIYFSFRDGLRGGLITVSLSVIYYFYIVLTHQQDNLGARIRTVTLFGLVYFAIAWVIGWLRVSMDTVIEQEANARRRLKAVIQQLPVGVIISDANGTLEMANNQAENILRVKIPIGHTVDDGYLVRSAREGKALGSAKTALKQILTHTKSFWRKEYEIFPADNKKRYVLANASVVRDKAGKPIAVASIFTDITEQKELELRKDDFINMASHELKTPITSIKLYLEILAGRVRALGDDKAMNAVERIRHQTEKLHELVVELLDVSRIQTGKLSLKVEQFRLDVLVKETVEVLQKSTKSPIRVIGANKPTMVKADKIRIYQVLTNLLSNAVKYSPQDKPIEVQLKRMNNQVVVKVKDRGLGIAKNKQSKIFDRLYQASDSPGANYPGLGMGLYIAREIIKRHRGKIWVESEEGHGAAFYFSLPLKNAVTPLETKSRKV